jgi:hypothetical protein
MSDVIPTSPEGYQPVIADLPDVPKGMRIDTSHPDYAAARKAAHAANLTQRQFGLVLAIEAQRVAARAKATKPSAPPAAPPPAPAEKIPGYAQMTMRQKLAAAGKV